MNEKATLGDLDRAALKAVSERSGPVVRLQDVAKTLKKDPIETANLMGKLQAQGRVSYSLTGGYALTKDGTKVSEAKVDVESRTIKTGTLSARTPAKVKTPASAKLPVQLPMPDVESITQKRMEKLKAYADQRARTRNRLRQLAQESIGRRPLRTLGD